MRIRPTITDIDTSNPALNALTTIGLFVNSDLL
ncbi:MAG: hypothetical protein H8D87_19685 [Deltaproteobacteria bacterium]|nr:hypothetical protein [Candidatus Desulfobacula maris]MBL6994442.1 hypothetical protein [Desulfobacula sp.]